MISIQAKTNSIFANEDSWDRTANGLRTRQILPNNESRNFGKGSL